MDEKRNKRIESIASEHEASRKEFADLVAKYERLANADAEAYKRKIWNWILLGYGIVFALAVGFVVLFVAIIYQIAVDGLNKDSLYGLIFVAIYGWIFCGSLIHKLPEPQGITLTRNQAPKLWALVDDLAVRLNTQPVRVIRIDDSFNAYAEYARKYVYFGPQCRTLGLGYQMMASFTVDELTSVIAHEMGHFSKNHSKFGVQVWSFGLTLQRLESSVSGSALTIMRAILNWCVPRFFALTDTLRRLHEFEADRISAEISGPATVAIADIKMVVRRRWLGKSYWTPLWRKTLMHSTMPENVLEGFHEACLGPIPKEFVELHLGSAIKQRTDPDDSHPSFSDRLESVGVAPFGPTFDGYVEMALSPFVPSTQSLIEDPEAFFREFQAWYRTEYSKSWKEYHAFDKQSERELVSLEAELSESPPSINNQVDLIMRRRELYGDESQDGEIVQIATDNPENAVAQLAAGNVLRGQLSLDAIPFYERAAELVPAYAERSHQAITELNVFHGRYDQARQAERALLRSSILVQQVRKDARYLSLMDQLVPTDLNSAQIEEVRKACRENQFIGKAYVCKVVKSDILTRGTNVLVVFPKSFLGVTEVTPRQLDQIATAFAFSIELFSFSPPTKRRAWKKKLEAIERSRIT